MSRSVKHSNIWDWPRLNLKLVVFRRDRVCVFCRRKLTKATVTLEHLIPVSLGGETTEENCGAACWKCNNDKGSKLPLDFIWKRVRATKKKEVAVG